MTKPQHDAVASRTKPNYVTRVIGNPGDLSEEAWGNLVRLSHAQGDTISPFIQYRYLRALHDSESACPATGWHPNWITIWSNDELCAAAPLYLKDHSRGEYVFDWAWARAYDSHGLPYYPKAVIAVPFTPVPGLRLLARDGHARAALIDAIESWAGDNSCSSVHCLFLSAAEQEATDAANWSTRLGVQFHWRNEGWETFDQFLSALQQAKRKKIKAERRKVTEAGMTFETLAGQEITAEHWDFFYRCYETTYWEHGNPPYLSRKFFQLMQEQMATNWIMFVAHAPEHGPVACSLVALSDDAQVVYGRYWGSLIHLSCLHFEACYYQPIEWCITHKAQRFEGGAQGEHKMARALMPTRTQSAHWIASAPFAQAVARFTEQEAAGVEDYQRWLNDRSPFKPTEQT